MNTEQLTKLASFAGKSANDFWMATGKRPTDVIAELAQELIEANGKVQALAAESVKLFNMGYRRGHEATVDGYYVDVHWSDIGDYHGDIVAEIIADDMPATSAAVAQIEASVRGEIIDWFETEIMAIDPIYRGYPSYEHGGYDIKHKVLFLVERAKKAFVEPGEAK